MKKCSKCKTEKQDFEFYPRRDRLQGKALDSKCKECAKIKTKEYNKRNPDKRVDYQLRRFFGLSLTEYNKILKSQGSRCLGCNKHASELPEKLAVDHCHKTGKIRGLLCRYCNLALGNAQDNPEILQSLITYLKRFIT